MADNEVQIRIIARNEAKKAFAEMAGGVKKAQGSMKDTIRTAGKYSAVVTGAIGAAGIAAVKAAADFESSMSNVNTLLGSNEEHFESLKSGIKEFATQSVKPLDELTSAMYDIVSAGVDMDDQLGTLRDSEKLAVAGLGSVQEATDLVTSSMNAFGVDSARAANTVFEAVQAGKTTVSELAQGFGAVAGTAKEMGVQYEEMLAITSTGTTVGKKASQVWTEQKAILTALTKPTAEMSKLYKELGVKSGKQLIETSGGVVGALESLKEATKGNDEMFAKALSSSEGLALANQLLGESYDTFQGTFATMTDGLNSIDEAYEKQKATTEALYQQMQNQLNVVMIELGEAILPIVNEALKGVTNAVQWLKDQWDNLTPAQKEMVIQSAEIAGAMLGIITVVGALMAVLNPVTAVLAGIGVAFVGLSAFLVENNLTWQELGAGIMLVLNEIGIKTLEAANTMIQAMASINPAFKLVSDGLIQMNNNTIEQIRSDVDAGWADIETQRAKRMEEGRIQMEDVLAQERDAVERLTGEAKDEALANYEAHYQGAVQKYGQINKGTTAEIAAMRSAQKAILNQVKGDAAGALAGLASSAFQWGANFVDKYTKGMWGKLGGLKAAVSAVSAALSLVHQSYNPLLPAQTWGRHFLENMVAGMKEGQPELETSVDDMSTLLKEYFGNDGEIMDMLKQWEADEVLEEKLGKIRDEVTKNAEEINKSFKETEKDYSDLRLKAAQELEEMTAAHEKNVQDMDDSIDALKQSLRELQDAYKLDIGGLDKSIGEKVVQQQDLVTELEQKIKDASATGGDVTSLTEQYEKESAALQAFMSTASGLEDEIAEARRRARLTDFERFIEDANARRESLTADFELRQQQIEEEISAVESAKERELQAFNEKMAKYDEVKAAIKSMESTFSQGLSSMATKAKTEIKTISEQLQMLTAQLRAVEGFQTKTSELMGGGNVPGFARGGVVDRPTLATLAEGGRSEAVVPLPDGRSIPVEMRGSGQTNVTFEIRNVNISKEVDGEAFIKKMEDRITRVIQLQKVNSF